jgi:hypothetical protein
MAFLVILGRPFFLPVWQVTLCEILFPAMIVLIATRDHLKTSSFGPEFNVIPRIPQRALPNFSSGKPFL